MMSQRKHPKLEVPKEELAEQVYSDEHEDDEQLAPLATRATSVSEFDWIEQQQNVPIDDKEQER
ncbi:hypothetical protein [Yaniella halotolerans]|uniref:hypothetical protein n=1 Tax=Yaniella halotolerans TaxID=225453 RepID=UPI0003B61C18|nr:hypothetical protein [Yaniella halotolerans]